jgi:hypothetical protein
MPYRFPRDASRQRQVLCTCTDRNLLQPTALVDCVSVCVCASVALSSRCVFVCVSVSWCVNETESDNTDVASTCVLREY